MASGLMVSVLGHEKICNNFGGFLVSYCTLTYIDDRVNVDNTTAIIVIITIMAMVWAVFNFYLISQTKVESRYLLNYPLDH